MFCGSGGGGKQLITVSNSDAGRSVSVQSAINFMFSHSLMNVFNIYTFVL